MIKLSNPVYLPTQEVRSCAMPYVGIPMHDISSKMYFVENVVTSKIFTAKV